MRPFDRIARRLRAFFRADQVEAELTDELRDHIEREAEELLREGWNPEAARREAFRRFGGVERTKERVRDERGGRLLADLVQDVRYAVRSLRKNAGFTTGALVVLALGIGASVSGLAVVRGVLLAPLPYAEPDRLVRVWPTGPEFGDQPFSLPNFLDWEEGSETLSAMGLYLVSANGWTLTLEGQGAEELAMVQVAGDLFGTLGVAPALGRALVADDVESSRNVAVLSDGAFQRLFGGDPSVVGQSVGLDYRMFEIVGVMPPGFSFPVPGTDAWVPVTTSDARAFPYGERGMRWGSAVARLDEGRTIDDARAELTRIVEALERAFPENNTGLTSATVSDLRATVVGDVEVALWSLFGAVSFFLLLSVANVANLLIARSLGRTRELALRRGLGASSSRVIRQLLTESTLLTLGGGLLGTALALVLIDAVASNAAAFIPRATDLRMDATMLIATVVVSLFVAGLAGLWPALRAATGADPSGGLRDGARALGSGGRGVRARRWLVTAEVALAALLLVGSSLLFRSFDALTRVDPGFEPEGAVAMTVNVPFSGYSENQGWVTLHQEILERLRDLPGAEVVGAIGYLPFRSEGEGWLLNEPEAAEGTIARVFPATTEAFRALGIPILSGRGFLASDGPDDVRVAVINETMAREGFPGEDPVGQRLVSGTTTWEIVGVVGDVRYRGLEQAAPPTFYSHIPQAPRSRQSYVVRTQRDPTQLIGPMRSVVASVDDQLPVSEILPLASLVSENSARPRFLTGVISGLAVLALVLAGLGVYGVLAYIVRGRSREMGLRAALGADRGQIVAHVLVGGMGPALAGLAIGLTGAWLLSRYLESLLFGIEPFDPLSFLAAGAVLAIVAAAACLTPAMSAAKVDPMVALRSE